MTQAKETWERLGYRLVRTDDGTGPLAELHEQLAPLPVVRVLAPYPPSPLGRLGAVFMGEKAEVLAQAFCVDHRAKQESA